MHKTFCYQFLKFEFKKYKYTQLRNIRNQPQYIKLFVPDDIFHEMTITSVRYLVFMLGDKAH